MEYRVDFHGLWYLEAVRSRVDPFKDREWTHSFVVQFVRRASRAKITSIEPDFISNLEIGLRHDFVVKMVSMAIQS
jgi:hypothetical protein